VGSKKFAQPIFPLCTMNYVLTLRKRNLK